MKLSKINHNRFDPDDASSPDYSDVVDSWFTDKPLLSMALEPKGKEEELKDKLSNMVDVATYGRSSGIKTDKDKDKHT